MCCLSSGNLYFMAFFSLESKRLWSLLMGIWHHYWARENWGVFTKVFLALPKQNQEAIFLLCLCMDCWERKCQVQPKRYLETLTLILHLLTFKKERKKHNKTTALNIQEPVWGSQSGLSIGRSWPGTHNFNVLFSRWTWTISLNAGIRQDPFQPTIKWERSGLCNFVRHGEK